jgi:hypothetical protein
MGISKLHWWLFGGIMWLTPTCEERQFGIMALKQLHQCFGSLHQDLIGFLSHDSQWGVLKLSWFGLSGLYEFIILCSDFRLGWGWKQTYSFPWKLSNGVLHCTCTHRARVDSQLLMVENQIASLTLDLSFCHNLCKCPNGLCDAIFDIYTLIAFQWYKKRFKAKCFDPCNQTLKFWKSRRTPKSPFRECECHRHTLPKVGLRQEKCWENVPT